MGNLQLSAPNSRSPLARRPIFGQPRNNSFSRSQSPYTLNTPRLNRSTIQAPRDPYSNRHSAKSCIYTCPRMIRSVIKNTPYQENRCLSYIKSIKRDYQDHPYFRKPRLEVQTRQSIRRQKNPYAQMAPISPCRSTIRDAIDCSKQYRQSLERDISRKRVRNQTYHDQSESVILGQLPKSPKNITKRKQKQTNSARGHPERICEQRHCCNHICSIQPSMETDRSLCFQHALTQRKNANLNNAKVDKSIAAQTAAKTNRYREETLEYSQCQTLPNGNQNLRRTALIHKQNRDKCQQIIKRVRNFNQFLIEVKRKLKKQAENAGSNNQSLSNITLTQQQTLNQPSVSSSIDQHISSINSQSQMRGKPMQNTRSITMALKLENEKIQLQKYRKLVERELSKQHSVASIEIQAGTSRQKIIKINFQPEPEQADRRMSKQSSRKSANLHKQNQMQQDTKEASIVQKSTKAGDDGKLISRRVSNINKLMDKMEGLTQMQGQNYKQMCELLKNQQTTQVQE